MTKKDFELIAATLQKVRADMVPASATYKDPDALHADICSEFADALASSNPRFDDARFLRACVPGANVRARS